ncbi:FHA domain-containing protein [Rhodobium gokarnense]|uniref:PSer/pThr/pTyr-binding forkhead associated (FHA) protein n=1 Tax=Rhodobium gokarnense TaxID=364296 RepID=A0ABT3H836_9HYPH|nr:FHA domain-containing protein [Rhodobium gokarnense]MCW2306557.1 pSer/pThr/pTyr-binding forkhead associated (FHA) protein [Rhodobium gokarnense]
MELLIATSVRRLAGVLCAALVGVSVLAAPGSAASEKILTRCSVLGEASKTRCLIRSVDGAAITRVEATVDGRRKSVETLRQVPEDPDDPAESIAILFMIDASKSMTVDAFIAIADQIADIVDMSKPRHRFGLATFHDDLYLKVAVGADKSKIQTALGNLERDGDNTAFYEAVKKGLDTLSRERSQRRFLVVMSDGLSEDNAYFPDDIVPLARQANIAIVGLGYPNPNQDPNAIPLQPIKRLAEETGGLFESADADGLLPADFAGTLFSLTDSGVSARIDTSDEAGTGNLMLLVTDADGATAQSAHTLTFSGKVPLLRRVQETAEEMWANQPLLLAAIALVFLLVLFLLLWLISRLFARRPDDRRRDAVDTLPQDDGLCEGGDGDNENMRLPPAIIYAHIDVLEGDPPPRRFDISDTKVRIGRGPGNDLVLSSDTVSNDHCVLTLQDDGGFEIRDVNSSNGTIVEGERIGRDVLEGGEKIVLGHVVLKFVSAAQAAAKYGA